jgi:hypothetical protein
MKKILILTVCLLLMVFCVGCTEDPAETGLNVLGTINEMAASMGEEESEWPNPVSGGVLGTESTTETLEIADFNQDGGINIADIQDLASYIFTGTPGPRFHLMENLMPGVALNTYYSYSVGDLTNLIDHVFNGGPEPRTFEVPVYAKRGEI